MFKTRAVLAGPLPPEAVGDSLFFQQLLAFLDLWLHLMSASMPLVPPQCVCSACLLRTLIIGFWSHLKNPREKMITSSVL